MSGISGLFSSGIDNFFKVHFKEGKLPEYTTLEKILACVPLIGEFIHINRDPSLNLIYSLVDIELIKSIDIEAVINIVNLKIQFFKNTLPFHVIAICLSIGVIFLTYAFSIHLIVKIAKTALLLHSINVFQSLYLIEILNRHITEIRRLQTIPSNLKKDLKKYPLPLLKKY